jgi:hypothetical protein
MKPQSQASHLACVATLSLVVLFATADAEATIVQCREVKNSFTVFLSEPSYSPDAFQSRDQLENFLQRLQFELDQERDGRWVSSPKTDVRFVMCVKRAPELDGQEFIPSLIDDMYHKRVLLEIWGELRMEHANDEKKLFAQMNYLLVPMKYAANQNEAAPAALQRLVYSDASSANTPGYVELIAQPQDIDAFVAAAFGFKLLREHNQELAHRNLCRASALLKTVEEHQLPSRTRKSIQSLRQFVTDSARSAIEDAHGDPKYSKTGVLWLHDPQHPCAGEE